MKWTYGDSWERFPVQFGEIWRVGGHYFCCGDLEEGHGIRFLDIIGVVPDLSYCDPPWNKGNAKSFRTKAGMSRDVNFASLLDRVIETLKTSRTLVFCEMGASQTQILHDVIAKHAGVVMDEFPITYYKKNACRLLASDFGGERFPYGDLSGIDDEQTPFEVLRAYSQAFGSGGLVLDCCVGRGIVYRASMQYGMRCVGMELNKRRLAVAIENVVDVSGGRVEKIGSVL